MADRDSQGGFVDSYQQPGDTFQVDSEQFAVNPNAASSPATEYTTLTHDKSIAFPNNDDNGNNLEPTAPKRSFLGSWVRDFAKSMSSKRYENASAPPIPLSEPQSPATQTSTTNDSHWMPPEVANATGYVDDVDDDFDDNDIDRFDRGRQILGLFCIFICVVDWVAMSEILALIEGGYNKPYFLRWVANSGYMFSIFFWFCARRCTQNRNKSFRQIGGASGAANAGSGGTSQLGRVNVNAGSYGDKTGYFARKKPFWRRILCASFVTQFVGFFAGYFWYLSLGSTTASVSNTIYQAQVAFVYPMSAVIMGAAITFQKNLGVFISLTGIILVSVGTQQDSSAGTNTFAGIMESVTSTFLYAVYEVAINYYGDKHFDPRQLIQDTLLFQFWIGLWSFMTLWPGLLLVDWWGIETFEWPHDAAAWGTVLIPVVMDLVFTSAFLSAIVLTNSFFVAMGTMCVVPLSYIADLLWNGYGISSYAIVGSCFVLSGFLLMEIPIVRYVRKKFGIKKSTFCFSERNRKIRIKKMKRMSMQDQSYYEYYR